MSDSIVFDLDDWCDAHAGWALPLLDTLYRESQGRLKVTLFTIPAQTDEETLVLCTARPWLELAVHGWNHTPGECLTWDIECTKQVLGAALATGVQHEEDDPIYKPLFKAPYWQAAPEVYEALADCGWAVAAHPRDAQRLPGRLRRYVLAPDHRVGAPHTLLPIVQAHGHVQDVEGNGLRERWGDFVRLARSGLPYKFVTEVVS